MSDFDAEWTIIELTPGHKSGCIRQESVLELRELLLECEQCWRDHGSN